MKQIQKKLGPNEQGNSTGGRSAIWKISRVSYIHNQVLGKGMKRFTIKNVHA